MGIYFPPSGPSGLATLERTLLNGVSHSKQVGRWYDGYRQCGTGSTTISYTANAQYCFPMFAPESFSVDRIGVYVSKLGSQTHYLAIYEADPVTFEPSVLKLNAGSFVDTTVGSKEIVISTSFTGGKLYYLSIRTGNTGVANFAGTQGNYCVGTPNLGYPTPNTQFAYGFYYKTGVSSFIDPVTGMVPYIGDQIAVRVRVSAIG